MDDTKNPNPGSPLVNEPRDAKDHQKTLLLSDVPNATALLAEAATPTLSPPQLSSTALAALGQRYDILGEAGHGSMGNVYKARDRETGETVALKLLKPEIASDQAMMERFKNELLFARKITHKNVCRVHEFNRIGGIAYTSMEFVEGESLRSVLNRFGGLPPRKAIDVALQICSGLKEAHAQGIVHRDLKPENVMIDAQGNVKIMDFGIARSMEALTRLTGSMVGTPAYMAPEQVAGKPVDYRSDIYSLGLMLYEMFTGTPAFQADTAVALALKQMRESPPPPHEVEPSIPVPIERAILKCLEKEPAKRFQSVAELETVLRPTGTQKVPAAAATFPTPHLSYPNAPHPARPLATKQESRHTSPFAWILLGAFVVVAALAGVRWLATVKSAENMAPPPSHRALPKPPEFSLEKPPEQPVNPGPGESTAAVPEPAKSAAATPTKHPAANVPPRVAEPAKKPFQPPAKKAFIPPNEPTTAANPFTYLWVGRFDREDRAQAAAKKIEDLGLPVVVVPRRNFNGEFFVIFAGPFGEKRLPDVKQWLEAQGFHNVRPVKYPFGPAPEKH
jgi:serine/threonine protein kinase